MKTKIIFISGREPSYIRNAVIMGGLQQNGVGVVECTSTFKSSLMRYPAVVSKYFIQRGKRDCDAVFIGFFGQPLVPIIKKLTPQSTPLIFDAYLSAYDTMCFDRKKFRPNSAEGRLMWWLDKRSCEIADAILLDTNVHIDYFVDTFGLEREKFHRVFIGADDSFFHPVKMGKENNKFRVLWHGSFLPLSGLEYVIKAAKLLAPYKNIEFKIVGGGIVFNEIERLIEKSEISNVELLGWVPHQKLPEQIAKADICLGGHFSDVDKAKRVIAGKTFESIAMKKPVVVGDNRANRELFQDGRNAVLCEMANPTALADAILELRGDEKLRERVAEEGYNTFTERCSPNVVGGEVKGIIEGVSFGGGEGIK